uniref:Uncharacterized protein n=1 Tax=Chromera velia CCMP2878 TaxID=1169474 RepID=A0A0G4IAK8_9ALVE|eukprot:Cvel_12585.t1-p1 / transcript=Cvel_12585.t1 / gene=Cvel_12585 / organism=Chromera_velia_CCMP2878 / gene_product=hypothetical protein / transcript_product=hypothetical protein / location=Cvel_scaffold829:19487-19974(+) / protein_length=82 / sequence_SO=supercontig / SO=protein_coding / is_pseudo=false
MQLVGASKTGRRLLLGGGNPLSWQTTFGRGGGNVFEGASSSVFTTGAPENGIVGGDFFGGDRFNPMLMPPYSCTQGTASTPC